MAALSLNPTVYAATSTTTLTTTVTGTYGQLLYLPFPAPVTTATQNPIQYTTIPSPTNPSSKLYLTPLPILLLTELDNVIVDPSGVVLQTATVMQGAPAALATLQGGQVVDPGAKVYLAQPGMAWGGWSRGMRGGLIAACVSVGLVLLGVGVWLARKIREGREKRKRYRELGDAEGGGSGTSLGVIGALKKAVAGAPKQIPSALLAESKRQEIATAGGVGGGNSINTTPVDREKTVPAGSTYMNGRFQDTTSVPFPPGYNENVNNPANASLSPLGSHPITPDTLSELGL